MSILDKIRQEAIAPSVIVSPRTDPLTRSLEKFSDEDDVHSATSQTESDNWEASLESELAAFPSIANRKVGVRLEEEILDQIDELCRQHNLTIETLLEAFFTVCNSKETLMQKIIQEAQSRIKRRTRAGNIRSVLTKTKNLKIKSR
jgi:hypothetical protein